MSSAKSEPVYQGAAREAVNLTQCVWDAIKVVAISVLAVGEVMDAIGTIKPMIPKSYAAESNEILLHMWDKAKSQAYLVQIYADRADRQMEQIANSLVKVWMGRVSLLRVEAMDRIRALYPTDENGTNSMTHLLSVNPTNQDATQPTTHLSAFNRTTHVDAEVEEWSKIQRIALNATRDWMSAKKKIERMYQAILDPWAQHKVEVEMDAKIDWPEFEKKQTAMKMEKAAARVTKAEQKLQVAVKGLQSTQIEMNRYVSAYGYWYPVHR
jgi:hypothetical protein